MITNTVIHGMYIPVCNSNWLISSISLEFWTRYLRKYRAMNSPLNTCHRKILLLTMIQRIFYRIDVSIIFNIDQITTRGEWSTYFSSASNFSKSVFSNSSLIKVLKLDVFLLLTTNESHMLLSRSVSTLSSWLQTGQHDVRVYTASAWWSHSPGRRRVQRKREERVPERVVDGDLQLAGQPQQTIVVGQLAVTGSGAHGGWSPRWSRAARYTATCVGAGSPAGGHRSQLLPPGTRRRADGFVDRSGTRFGRCRDGDGNVRLDWWRSWRFPRSLQRQSFSRHYSVRRHRSRFVLSRFGVRNGARDILFSLPPSPHLPSFLSRT